MSEFTSKAC